MNEVKIRNSVIDRKWKRKSLKVKMLIKQEKERKDK